MKKAKIALTFVAVLAVVGGALAFKAKQSHNFYSTDTAGGCSSLTVLNSIQTTEKPDASRSIVQTELSTLPTAAPCPVITIKPNA